MIANQDRSGWIGASDTAHVMGRWDTLGFARWWSEKLGLTKHDFVTREMLAGTYYEHRILAAIGATRLDRQIRNRALRLRVNLDGEKGGMICEVKTYGGGEFRVTKPYWMQCQVQMFSAGEPCQIVAYRLKPEDYDNFFNTIDPGRVTLHPIPYDPAWVMDKYLPRLRVLAAALKRGALPNAG